MEYLPENLIDLSTFDNWFNLTVAKPLGLQPTIILFLLLQISQWPLSYMFMFINGAKKRHIWGLIFSIPIQYLMYREKVLLWWFVQISSYLFQVTLGKRGLIPVFLVSFSVLMYQHYDRFYYGSEDYKVTVDTILMLGLMKTVSLAFSLSDGQKTPEEIAEYSNSITKNQKTRKFLYVETTSMQIKEMPSFFEYISYMNCFYTSICGPYLDYNEHKNWIEQRGTYANIPSNAFQLLKWFGYLVLVAYIFSQIQPYFPLEDLLSKEYSEMDLWRKIYIATISGTLVRSKYYLCWCTMQNNLIASGIAYGKDKNGKDTWDAITWCDPKLELPFYTLKERIDMWNISPTKFFRKYIYQRLMSIVNIQLLCLMGVFGFNSMWHGLNAGYYITLFGLVVPLIEC